MIIRVWAALLAAGVLAACAGSSAPPSTATRPHHLAKTPAGPRFIAASGWHTAQVVSPQPPLVPSAVAANFPVTVPAGMFPTRSELRHIPARGIVVTVSVWSSTHGFDLRAHPIRALPLRFSESTLRRRFDAVPTTARWYLLGARVHGHIVEVNIFVNRHTPAPGGLIQSELDRIVVPTR
ncbi:MAG TPA: hypothetical protein VGL44_10540 [Gaiellales bacterium]